MKHPVVAATMGDGGVMRLGLYPGVVSGTVSNFLSLVRKGFYNSLISHRIIEDFMIQGGCPIDNSEGGPGYVIEGEFKQNDVQDDLKHEKGVILIACTSTPSPAGSQFFIMHKAAPHLDGSYTAFGKLIEGEDVLNRTAMTKMNTADKSLEDQKIKTVTVETFGETYPEPEKLPEIEY